MGGLGEILQAFQVQEPQANPFQSSQIPVDNFAVDEIQQAFDQTQATMNVPDVTNVTQKVKLPPTDDGGGGNDTFDTILKVVGIIASIWSDRRLKDNIQLVGSIDGINMYSYNYIGDNLNRIGVMAQEVPWASSVHESGYLMVDPQKVFK
jgi:hypothetical protein